MRRWTIGTICFFLWGCAGAAIQARPRRVRIAIVGTNDVHGHLGVLPVFAGYLHNLRSAPSVDSVLLFDGGDMFQGTLESNREEGASMVRAYNALGYDAVTIGNHEFDYGPAGPRATPRDESDDPRGALRARIAEAHYPFLSANLALGAGSESAGLGVPSVLLERAGVKIGVIGVTTESTPSTTIAANVADLSVLPLADSIRDRAQALRSEGAKVIVVLAHAGGDCESAADPDDLSSCREGQEIFDVARALPPGAVDVIVGGHTHKMVAHRVNGVAIIESYALGRAFGRVDVTIEADRVREVRIHPPQMLCSNPEVTAEEAFDSCAPATYEGRPVLPRPEIVAVTQPAIDAAAGVRERRLGPILSAPLTAEYRAESALGNFFTDMMRRARPSSDVALINGGGLRADLPAGELRYGDLYRAFPFDNRFATLTVSAAEVRAMFATMLENDSGFLSQSGLEIEARCESGELRVVLSRQGHPVPEDAQLTVLVSDFLASGGDGIFALARERGTIAVEDDALIREALSDELMRMGEATIDPSSYAPTRIRYPGTRPVDCSAAR